MLAAFAVAVQAGTDKACSDKESSGCCGKAKAAAQAKGECPMAKQAKTACPYAAKKDAKAASVKPALQSPKAMADAGK